MNQAIAGQERVIVNMMTVLISDLFGNGITQLSLKLSFIRQRCYKNQNKGQTYQGGAV